MKYFRMFFWGSIGIVLALVVFFIMATYFEIIYGLVVSLMGTLAGIHAVLGYTGRDKVSLHNIKKIRFIGVVFALIASALPYYLIYSSRSAIDLLFIFIGAYGGLIGANYVLIQRLSLDAPEKEPSDHKLPTVTAEQRRIILQKKMSFVLKKNLSFLVPFLFLTMVFKSLGIVWVLVLIFFIYDLFRFKVFSVSQKDLDELSPRSN